MRQENLSRGQAQTAIRDRATYFTAGRLAYHVATAKEPQVGHAGHHSLLRISEDTDWRKPSVYLRAPLCAAWFAGLIGRNAGGAKRRVNIGRFGAVTVEQARRAAKIMLGQVAGGGDPMAERKAAAEAATAAKAADEYTFARMVQAWAAAREGHRRPSYLKEAVACLTRNLPDWQERAAAGVTFAEAIEALDGIKTRKGTVAANRTLAYGRAAYSWAVRRQQAPTNPFKGMERPGQETPRERVLSLTEMAAIWRACDSLSPTRAAFVRTLMLTLQRVGEVESMRWTELDNPTDPTTWELPGERSKNGKPHVVHLAEPMRTIIRSQPRLRGNGQVFPGRGGEGAVNGSTHTKDPIEAALGRVGVTTGNWRLHDFRRAGVTALAERGIPPHIADRLLNHITGSISGVAAVYQKAQFLVERQAALDLWAQLVLAEVGREERPDEEPARDGELLLTVG